MQKLHFLKLIPGGNPTILISAPYVAAERRMDLSRKLMHPLHLQAEQVGFAEVAATPPHLDMMGGEFCLNATRCLIFEAARQGRFFPLAATDDLLGLVSCSGMPTPLPARVKNGKIALRGKVAGEVCLLDCRVAFQARLTPKDIQELEPGAALLCLPGISHLLLDENLHQLPEDPILAAAGWRKKLNLEQEAACGVVWYGKLNKQADAPENILAHKTEKAESRQEYAIIPVVHVAGLGSVLESACGSASLALGLLQGAESLRHGNGDNENKLNELNKATLRLDIRQPSQEILHLEISCAHSPEGLDCAAEIGGLVSLCAEGETFLPA